MSKHNFKHLGSHVSHVPSGVKVIAILEYIYTAIFFIGAIVLCAIAIFIGTDSTDQLLTDFGMSASVSMIFGMVFLFFSIASFIIARGLWKGRNWARIVEIVFSILGVVSGIMLIVSGTMWGFVELIINGIIVGYLGFNEYVKNFFNPGYNHGKA